MLMSVCRWLNVMYELQTNRLKLTTSVTTVATCSDLHCSIILIRLLLKKGPRIQFSSQRRGFQSSVFCRCTQALTMVKASRVYCGCGYCCGGAVVVVVWVNRCSGGRGPAATPLVLPKPAPRRPGDWPGRRGTPLLAYNEFTYCRTKGGLLYTFCTYTTYKMF